MSSAAKKGKGGNAKRASKKGGKKDPKPAKKDVKAKGGAASKKGKKDVKAKDPKSAKKDVKAGAASKKGKGKKDAEKTKAGKATKSTKGTKAVEESKQQEPKRLVVDFGPPVILPETKEYITEIAEMTATKLEDDENVEELEEQFAEFEKLLKKRKKECLANARASVGKQGEETAPICIDIDGMKHLISNIGTKRGELDYAVLRSRQQILDRGRELLAYEAKHAGLFILFVFLFKKLRGF